MLFVKSVRENDEQSALNEKLCNIAPDNLSVSHMSTLPMMGVGKEARIEIGPIGFP